MRVTCTAAFVLTAGGSCFSFIGSHTKKDVDAMECSGAQILIQSLLDQGVDTIFGYPGGAVLNIYDALFEKRGQLRHVLMSHEQGAAHAADGYARATGKTGVALATSGPGATNLVTGIATAYMDSVPLVAITGNVATDLLGRDSFQEVDITGITAPITKRNYILKDARELAGIVREAFAIANSGRPGPVLIDIPKDITAQKAPFESLPRFIPHGAPPPDPAAIRQAAQAIQSCARPLIYAGGGVISANAAALLTAFAEHIHAPVCTSAMGLGTVPYHHTLCLGMIGMHGTPVSNYASSRCDLLIAVGSRFSDRVAGKRDRFAPNAQILHIDIDASELSKNVTADIPVAGDLKAVLGLLLEQVRPCRHEEWVRRLLGYKAQNPLPAPMDEESVHPGDILRVLHDLAGDSAIIVTDVGQHQMMTAQYYRFTRPRTFISSCGLGTMGYGMGAAIGVKTAFPDRPVILITGDGSFHMNMNETAAAVSEACGVVALVMNNSVLGMVRQWQKLFYGGRYSSTSIARQTDLVRLAEAFGAKGLRIARRDQIRGVLSETLEASRKGPCIVDCVLDKDLSVYPIVPPGSENDAMIYCDDC